MRNVFEIEYVIKQLEEALPELKEQSGPFQTLSIYGVIDALKWVIDRPSFVNELIRGVSQGQVVEDRELDREGEGGG